MKRSSLVGIGLLLAAVGAVLFGAEWARRKLEQELSRFLQIPVRIERINLSPRHLTLHEVTLPAAGPGSTAPLRIERLQLDGIPWGGGAVRSVTLTGLTLSLAGLPLKAQGRVYLTAEPHSYARAEGWLNLEHPFLSGRVEVSGRLLKPAVLGWLEWPGDRRRFVAQLDIRREALRLERMEIQGGWSAGGSLSLSSPCRGTLSAAGPEEERFLLQVNPSASGGARAVLSILRTGVPPQEISVDWSVRGSSLELEARLFNGQAVLSGEVGLIPPYRSALRLGLNDLDLAEWASWFPVEEDGAPPSGRIQGQITLSGPLQRPAISGRLSGRKGRLGPAEFDWIYVHFLGTGPLIHLRDSHWTGPVGPMRMEGGLDLRRMGQGDFLQGIRLAPADRVSREAGWPLALTPSSTGLKLGRTGEEEGMNLRADLDRDGEFVGVEHRKKF